MPARLFDETEAESRTFPDRLRGGKWLEFLVIVSLSIPTPVSATDRATYWPGASAAKKPRGRDRRVRLGRVQTFLTCLAFSAYWADREHGTDPRIVR
jgi:hypothetical protein